MTLNFQHMRSAFYIMAFAALLCCGALLAQSDKKSTDYKPDEDAVAYFDTAVEHLNANDLISAREEAVNATQEDDQWPKAAILLAQIELQHFEAISAKNYLERALSMGAKESEVNHHLGEALWLLGEHDEAEKALTNTPFQKDQKIHAQRILARIYMDKGDMPKAQTMFDDALNSGGRENSMLWTDIARYRLVGGDTKAAIEAADYAVQLDNNNVRALTLRGRMIRDQVGLLPALAWFERALEIRPDDVTTLEEYAATLGEAGRYSDMLAIARRILEIDGKSGRAYYFQAVIAARAGEYGLALRILNVAGAEINDMPAAMLLTAICEYYDGNENKAIDVMRKLSDQQPHNMRVRKILARMVLKSGDSKDAIEAIKPLAWRDDADSYSLRLAARAFEADGDRVFAAKGLDGASTGLVRVQKPLDDYISDAAIADAMRRNAGDARYAIPYIRSLMRNNNMSAALSNAQRLRAQNPGVADVYIIEGDIYYSSGSMANALAAYKKASGIKLTDTILLRIAATYGRLGKFKEQREFVSNHLKHNPTSLPAWRLWGYYQIDDGNIKGAQGPLEYVLLKTGYNDSILLSNLARVSSALGDHDKAIGYAATAYEIDPANPMVTLTYGEVQLASGKRPKAAVELLQKAVILLPNNNDAKKKLKAAKSAVKS